MSLETRTAPTACPFCEYEIDAATSVAGDHRPSPGDLTVCISCAQILLFDESLAPRQPVAGELQAIFAGCTKTAENLRRVQQAIRALDRHDLRSEAKS